jgi:hypothetical protein
MSSGRQGGFQENPHELFLFGREHQYRQQLADVLAHLRVHHLADLLIQPASID